MRREFPVQRLGFKADFQLPHQCRLFVIVPDLSTVITVVLAPSPTFEPAGDTGDIQVPDLDDRRTALLLAQLRPGCFDGRCLCEVVFAHQAIVCDHRQRAAL